jgi:membrane protease YdiL (CAAX protease family)
MPSGPADPDPAGPATLCSPASPAALRPAPALREVVLVLGLVFVLNLGVGFALILAGPRLSLLATQAIAFALPPFAAIRLFYLDRRAVLPFRAPELRHLVAAVAGAIGLNHLLTFYGAWQERIWPAWEPFRTSTETLLRSEGALDFAAMVAAVAIVPALCEEILFRGFVQSGLVPRLGGPWRGVASTAVVFGLFHLDPWRFLLVVPLGIFLGWLRHVSGSLWPAILAHALNNALTASLMTAGLVAEDRAFGSFRTALPAAALVSLALFLGRRPSGSAGHRVL